MPKQDMSNMRRKARRAKERELKEEEERLDEERKKVAKTKEEAETQLSLANEALTNFNVKIAEAQNREEYAQKRSREHERKTLDMKKAADDAERKAQRAESLLRGASRTVDFKTAQLEHMKKKMAKLEEERDDAREARANI